MTTMLEVALDPQTSGGLLIALPEDRAAALVSDLEAHGVGAARVIGRATAVQGVFVRLV